MGSPSVICYPQPGKHKSRSLLEAFAQGCGGRVVDGAAYDGQAAAFYGVVGLEAVWQAAREAGRYYYLDNAYFDATRGKHFRVGVNALQASGTETPDWLRFSRLALGIQPWRRDGRHVVVVEQSAHFMAAVAGWPVEAWREHVVQTLARHTDRLIVVRHWHRDKAERVRTLREDLKDAWAVVTHTSAAANEALVAGIPVFLTGPSAALPMGSNDLTTIEKPLRPDGRYDWAASLAGRQWTVEELRDGTAWKALNEA